MSSTRRKLRHPPVVNGICCGCRKLKISGIFNPKPKARSPLQGKPINHHSPMSSSERRRLSVGDGDESRNIGSTDFFSNGKRLDSRSKNSAAVRGGAGMVGESTAVVKNSDDPYRDFKHSMIHMIVENEIYSQEDLQELLHCFLSLNSPYHHQIIFQAFSEIWNQGPVSHT